MLGTITIDVTDVMPRCRGCAYWNQEDDRIFRPGQGVCTVTIGDGRTIYMDRTQLAYPWHPWQDDPARNRTWLLTDAEYGCVQFEAKPDA